MHVLAFYVPVGDPMDVDGERDILDVQLCELPRAKLL